MFQLAPCGLQMGRYSSHKTLAITQRHLEAQIWVEFVKLYVFCLS